MTRDNLKDIINDCHKDIYGSAEEAQNYISSLIDECRKSEPNNWETLFAMMLFSKLIKSQEEMLYSVLWQVVEFDK